MRRATLTEAKNRLSALIDTVRAGDSVLILDRGVPVARIEPVAHVEEDAEDRLRRLERRGLVRPAAAPVREQLVEEPPPAPRDGISVVDVLIEERRTGR